MSIRETTFDQLSEEDRILAQAAEGVMRNAYNVYSKFYVGASALSRSGNLYCGTFMENSSYGLTICAEPAALLAANTAKDLDITKMAVIGGSSSELNVGVVTPCGRCRQIIFEASKISGYDIEIICCDGELTRILIARISDFLPFPFWNHNHDKLVNSFHNK